MSVSPTGIWKDFQTLFAATQPTSKLTNTYLTNGFGWVIGPFNQLEDLRELIVAGDPVWADFLKRGAKLGRRATDAGYFGSSRAPAFRAAIANKPPEKTDKRLTEQYAKADAHWSARPLEAHHILEDKTLEKIGAGLNKGDFARNDAPCVLLVAELHQRLITDELRESRHKFKGASTAAAKPELISVYTEVYKDPTMKTLQQIALKSIERLIP